MQEHNPLHTSHEYPLYCKVYEEKDVNVTDRAIQNKEKQVENCIAQIRHTSNYYSILWDNSELSTHCCTS